MKKIILFSFILFFVAGLSFAQTFDDYESDNNYQTQDYYYDDENDFDDDFDYEDDDEDTDTEDYFELPPNPKRDELVNSLIRYITTANYKGINHDGLYTMTAESVVIYSTELIQYEPFKTFGNQLVATQYILNKASISQGLEPVYSINGETNPDKWPLKYMTGTTTVSPDANGYRRKGYHGISSTIDTITYHNEEEQRKFDEKSLAEKSLAEKKKNTLLQKYIATISSANYDVYYDGTKKRYFLATEDLIEAYSKEINKLLSRSYNNENTVKYILNKASYALGYEPVYSVNNIYDPDNWNLPRYKVVDEAAAANGFRIASPSELSAMDKKNTDTNYIVVRYDGKIITEKKAAKIAAGKFFLDSIGLSIKENKSQSIILYFKNGTKITTNNSIYKIFCLIPEKKSASFKMGIKDDDLFVIHGIKNSPTQSTCKIFIDDTVVDLTSFGANASVDDIYAAFSKALYAKKITIQVRRKSMGSYDLKEVVLKK